MVRHAGANSPLRIFASALAATLAAAISMAPNDARADSSAIAPDDGGGSQGGGLDEIVVTAQKREERAQDVGISIAAYSGEMLEKMHIVRPEDLTLVTPGLTSAADNGSSVSSFSIRGVGQGDYADHQEQPNAVYQDGVYVAMAGATGFPLYDLQTVEVLRGPQGTLFGRNATGGLLHFESVAPKSTRESAVTVSYGDRNLSRIDGYYNTPLTEHLDMRLSVYGSASGGWVKNTLGPDLMTDTTWSPRLQFLYTPSGDTSIRLIASGFHKGDRGGAYENVASYLDASGLPHFLPPDLDYWGTGPGNNLYGYRNPHGQTWTVDQPTIGHVRKNVSSASMTIDHRMGTLSFVSITGYERMGTNYLEGTDDTPAAYAIYRAAADAKEYSQEFRLQRSEGPTRWVAGLYGLSIKGNYSADFNLPTLEDLAATGADLFNVYGLDTQSESVFGQVEHDLGGPFTLIAGARYTWDSKDIAIHTYCTQTAPTACRDIFLVGITDNNGVPLPTQANIGHIAMSSNSGDWSGRLQLNYHPSKDLLLYASASKGIKGGGFSVDLNGFLSPDQLRFDPERLFAYEIGEKAEFMGGKARVNGSLYYYDYKSLQTFQFIGISSQVLSRPALVKGGELELTLRPARGTDLSVGVSYSDFTVHDIFVPWLNANMDQVPANAPKWKVNWLAGKSWPVGGNLELGVHYDGTYLSGRYYNVQNAPTLYAPGYTLHNAAVSLGNPDRHWEVSLWANNAGNKAYITEAFDTSALSWVIRRLGPPRWIGATYSIKF